MMLRLRTLGAVHVERDGVALGGAHSQRRRLALLAYLAAADKAAVSRDKMVALLWPESDTASGRHSLSQLLYAVRHDLGADVMAVDSESVRLDPTVLRSDVRDFDAAMRAGKHEEAVALYEGAFLDGFHVDGAPELERWIDDERGRRAQLCARALDQLADAAEKAGDWHRAVDWLRRRAAIEPTEGRASLRLMRALVSIGDRDGALRTARVYETLMRDLDDEPDPSVVRYADEIRRGTRQPAAAPSAPSTPLQIVDRPATHAVASQGATVSTMPARRTRSSIPAQRWIAGVAAVMVLSVALMARTGRSTTREGASSDRSSGAVVVIGDFEGRDPVLALALREALRAELVNTRGVRLTSDQGIRELKALMRLPRDTTLRTQQMLALAVRGGAHVALTGSVVPIGAGAQIVVEVLDPVTGQPIQTFTERPEDPRAILAAVGRLARSIGAAISNAPLDETVRPLPAVTTASLAALKSYALARQTAASGRRLDAVAPAERAVTHDSTFVLAHYFLGDLLWFIDEQTHSEAHLTKAYELRFTVPTREQLAIRARYEQLARDRPDSALAYWQLLSDASPGDVLAYEGRTWALRALGRHEEAAASADTAMSLDPGALLPNITNAVYSWLAVGDTASALAIAGRVASRRPEALIEARYYAALFRDPAAAMPWVDSTRRSENRHFRRHIAQVAQGDAARARVTLDSVLKDDRVQMPPNALLNQGWVELVAGEGRPAAARHARAALVWTRSRDLSPPAIGRLSERIADLAARAGDEATVRGTIALVRGRDRGRSLPTYVMTLRALDAAHAYVRGDYARAAQLAEAARHGVYFSRSLATLVKLEADARRAAGQPAAADSLDRLLDSHQIVDGNFDVWAILRALTKLPRPASAGVVDH